MRVVVIAAAAAVVTVVVVAPLHQPIVNKYQSLKIIKRKTWGSTTTIIRQATPVFSPTKITRNSKKKI